MPRFFIHKIIEAFAQAIVSKHGQTGQRAMLFPTRIIAERCRKFAIQLGPELEQHIHIVDLVPSSEEARSEHLTVISPRVSAVLFPEDKFSIFKQFWQHSGDGVSSRRAEYCHGLFNKGILVEASTVIASAQLCKGPKRYRTKTSIDLNSSAEKSVANSDPQDPTQFVEERFGRNLDLSLTRSVKLAVRRRIAGSLTEDVGLTGAMSVEEANSTGQLTGRSEDDVYLYPCGMSAIFNAHRNLMATKGPMKSIVYGYDQ